MRWCYPRHKVLMVIMRILLWPFMKIKYGMKFERHKLDTDKPYLILANHRGFWDPFLVSYVYNRPIHFMATDNLFTNGFVSKLLVWAAAPIPKKKQGADLKAIRAAMQVASENGVIGVFPEGSRSFDGAPTSIDVGIAQLAKLIRADIVLCGLYGVYASDPRWSSVQRQGNSLLKTVKVITAEEAAAMDDEELRKQIEDALDIEEAPSRRVARTSKLAEKLESFLYVCPKCGSTCTLYSTGNEFGCTACGMHGHVNPNLSLDFDDDSIKVRNLVQWHRIQRRFGRNYVPVSGQEIFRDDNVDIYEDDKKSGIKKLLGKGTIRLRPEEMKLEPAGAEPVSLEVGKLRVVSPVGMKKLVVSGNGFSYFIEGVPGFNGYKYAQMFYTLTGQLDREVK